jgi:dihydropyrimidinase
MSAKEAVETVSRGDMGANVFGETCPQYLYFSLEEHLMKPGFEGAAYVCSTPIRSRAEGHQEALWRYLRTNDLSVVATDHCPFCMKDQKDLGLGDFSKIPNGIGGVEHRMDTIYQGVVSGEIGLPRWQIVRYHAGGCSASIRKRVCSCRAATPTSWCTTRTPRRRSVSTTRIT